MLGGGGYNPWTLARCWAGLWGVLAGFPMPEDCRKILARRLAALDCDLVEEEDRDPTGRPQRIICRAKGPVRDEIRAIAGTIRSRLRNEPIRNVNCAIGQLAAWFPGFIPIYASGR